MRSDHRHLTAYQIGCQVGQSVGLILRPAILDRHILALDVAGFTKALGSSEVGVSARADIGRSLKGTKPGDLPVVQPTKTLTKTDGDNTATSNSVIIFQT